MARHPFVGLMVAGGASLMAHGLAYASLAFAPKPVPDAPPSRVSFRVSAPAPKPEPPAPPPKPPEPPAPEPPRVAKPKAEPPPNSEPVVAPPPAVDLTGVTLTNDTGGGSWASAVGNGSALNGPLGPIGSAPKAKPSATPAAVAVSRVPGIPLVELADLSTKPVPPELAGNLRDLYPAEAKQRAIGGSASVEARIEPDGRVRRATLKNETFTGFGDACRRALLGSRWSAPRDHDGRPVATVVRYTCRFVVQP